LDLALIVTFGSDKVSSMMLDNQSTLMAGEMPLNSSPAGADEAVTPGDRLAMGGLVWRLAGDGLELLAIVQTDGATWSLPR
jgi:hypothetical protein